MLLSRAMLETAAADYDRLTGGRLAEHAAASPPAEGPDHGAYPFAWAVLRLREPIGTAGLELAAIRTTMRWRRCMSWRCII